MSSVFTPDGKQTPVTACLCPPLIITKVEEGRIQVAYGAKKNINKAQAPIKKQAKLKVNPRGYKVFKLISEDKPKVGDSIAVDVVFSEGDIVKVTGTSKGRGFAGAIKRHGFHRQPVTRGQSDRTRSTGAIGAQTPGRVLKGKKMPGHYGGSQVSIKNLKIIKVDKDQHSILVSGSFPGHINSWIKINKQSRK